jgi:hypothetical protein
MDPDFKDWGYIGDKVINGLRVIWLIDVRGFVHIGAFRGEVPTGGVSSEDVHLYCKHLL